MRLWRTSVAALLSLTILFSTSPTVANSNPSLGILTLAFEAHLGKARAYAGLSIFDGEELATEREGRATVRLGHTTIGLAGETTATLHRIGTSGAHIDLDSGCLSGFPGKLAEIEIHVAEALLPFSAAGVAQAQIRNLGAGALELTSHGSELTLCYREECRNLPEGQTYRIYLDSFADARGAIPGTP